MNKKVLVIAHRGASDKLPDNTIESFDQAVADQADMIELDVRRTADGYLVVFHNRYAPKLKRAERENGASRAVSRLTYGELRLACERQGFKLALLEEVLKRYAGRIILNIEVKATGYEKEICDLVRKYGMEKDVIISSFMPWVVKKTKIADNSLLTGWIIGQKRLLKTSQPAQVILKNLFTKLNAYSIHINHRAITPKVLKRFHDIGVPVYAWTVNDIKRMKYLIDLGIDGIITNKPADLRALLNGEEAGITKIKPKKKLMLFRRKGR